MTPKKRKDLEKILDDFDPHILHYSSPTAMGNYAVKYGNKRDKVVVSIYHTHYPSFVTYYIGFIPLVVRLVERLFYRLYKLLFYTLNYCRDGPAQTHLLAGTGFWVCDMP